MNANALPVTTRPPSEHCANARHAQSPPRQACGPALPRSQAMAPLVSQEQPILRARAREVRAVGARGLAARRRIRLDQISGFGLGRVQDHLLARLLELVDV